MFSNSLSPYAIALSFALALALTPLVRALARRVGAVARPKADRWHKKPTAMLGGVAIFLSVALAQLATLKHTPSTLVVLAASAFLFAVGLVDDVLRIKPYQKLIGQVMGAALVIYYGLTLPWTASAPLNMAITIFWLIGITNAVNLLDNMDGLAAGIAAIASTTLAFSFLANGQPNEALMLGVFAAALIGFLIYNSYPASIFMGDCGSMFVGFFLSSTALLSAAGGRSRSFLPVLAVPVLILFVPIFDTTFVTILRKLAGRSASQGGRDHTSHRLVALGMSERRAVWMLYGFAALSGMLALLVRDSKIDTSLAAILGFTVVLTLLGVYLAGVKVYDESEIKAVRDKALFAFLIDLSYKRRFFEVLLDVVLIILAYYGAYALLFGSLAESGTRQLFLQTVPVLVFIKMAAFLVTGVYRGIWRYTSVDDFIVFAKAVALGSLGSVLAILFAFRFQGFSRTVFVIDGMLLLMMLAGSRMAFRLFRQILPTPHASGVGRRVLIYGAGDAGDLLLREMLNNPRLRYVPVGFVDDDPLKAGKVVHGFRVFGGNGALRGVCADQKVEEVLISSAQFSEHRVREILRDCEEAHVALKRMRIEIESLTGDDDVN
ncbi:MAG: glycosyl transferase [Pyrinomonadaceae bacterium]|nr:glycosyl transferase [Pyrinomonadaceae bacterium]